MLLVAHTDDVLLGLAAAVLQLLDDVEVSEVRCVYYSLCTETNLAAYVLDCCLHATDCILQLVHIAVKILRQLTKSNIVALHCVHQESRIIAVLHLCAKARNLILQFRVLQIAATVIPVSHPSHHHHIGKRVIHPVAHTTVHCCQHSRWIIVSTSSEQGCC